MRAKWTDYEERVLCDLSAECLTDHQIATRLGKPEFAIKNKRWALGIKESPFSTALRRSRSRKHHGKTLAQALASIRHGVMR